MFDFWLDSVKSAEFFFFLATLHSQKIVKEIAYILTSFQAPFKSAIFFYFVYLFKLFDFNCIIEKSIKVIIEDA